EWLPLQDAIELFSKHESYADISEVKRGSYQREHTALKEYILKSLDKIYSEFTDAEKKRFIGSFVERVEIYEEEQENGRFLKSIKFRFPVYYNGTETQEVNLSDSSWDYQRSLETVCLLSNTQSKKKESYITLDVEMADYYRIKNEGKNSTTLPV
ncbi:MAG: hypothetical protein IJU43_00975, partial [Lachnospiraceae bacterium]|nr:hypothetical protein [Lachnospiraceae bacterium]